MPISWWTESSKGAGFERFEILEQAGGLGGTWYYNRYPGCACDVSSHLYSYSFEIKRDWSRPYAPQPEILAYLEHCAEKYGLLPHCRFGEAVRRARWDEAAARWTLELASGRTVSADVVVSAIGMFNEIAMPDIPGLDSFAGTRFHSSRWNGNHDLSGETVGVIGSAASAVQLVPEIVKQAGRVHLFQRTATGWRRRRTIPTRRRSSSASAVTPGPRWRCGGRSSRASADRASSRGCVPRWRDRGDRAVAGGLHRLLPRPERPHRHPVAALHARAGTCAVGPRRGFLRGGRADARTPGPRLNAVIGRSRRGRRP